MTLIGNIFWLIFGGLFMALGWVLLGVLAYLSIIFSPWGRACFTIATLTLMPFGNEIVDRRDLRNKQDIGTGPLGLIGNIIWLVFGGIWLALGHAITGILLFITIIGIPFGLQHFKLARVALMPIGKEIVPRKFRDIQVSN